MLDLKFIRENKELLREAIRKRHFDFDINRFFEIDEMRRALLQEVENMRANQNKASQDIVHGSEKEKEAALIAMRALKDILGRKEDELNKIEKEFNDLLLKIPNTPDPTVPEGYSDADNLELRNSGPIPQFSFKIKSSAELLASLDLADFERGVKISGFRGYFLKNEGVKLSFALWQLALDSMAQKGFTPFISPALVRENIFTETGKLPLFREDLYGTEDKLLLSPTAEIPMMGYHEDEILSEDDLPIKYAAFSACYRREAGSYGKDEKGLFRVHEFMKVEQIVLCKAEHQESVKWHEELTGYSEEIVRALELPYRLMINSSGDLPFGAVKMYDIECWIPSEQRYRETHSSSIIHDFQTRRLKIRYKTRDGKILFAHSLNNTALATPRIFNAILENHQQEDGSVSIPEALRKYMGADKILPKDKP
ncbi:serine--tRNA ligase [Candidatus Giovannonibacteria bacterium]|nr:serine--tRNA ligase [Candidatus Giovannonibacteria bacterium]